MGASATTDGRVLLRRNALGRGTTVCTAGGFRQPCDSSPPPEAFPSTLHYHHAIQRAPERPSADDDEPMAVLEACDAKSQPQMAFRASGAASPARVVLRMYGRGGE